MRHLSHRTIRFTMFLCGVLLCASACAADDSTQESAATSVAPLVATATPAPTASAAAVSLDEGEGPEPSDGPVNEEDVSVGSASDTSSPEPSTSALAGPLTCDQVAAMFVTRGSANPDLEDPEVAASCEAGSLVVISNAVPDYTYIGTSPGSPGGREYTFAIPSTPVMAEETTAVPYIGSIGITLSGIPIYGPTEGTGGDVDSLPGIVSACGSHMGPTGFHTHKILTSSETDCFFTPAQVAESPQLVGYAFDGIPIYTGIDQYTSSWELTDETLFASDTWAAHSYVEGSGDLDQCNGLTSADGNYAYYTTEGFPYVLGCFAGEVNIGDAGGGGGDRPQRPEGDNADRPERPDPDEDEAEEGEGS